MGKFKNFGSAAKHIIEKDFMYMEHSVLGVKHQKAVFISFTGKSYSDSPRAISEKLHELHPEFDIVWLFRNPEEKRYVVPEYVRCVEAGSLEALKELATAKFWVDNFTKPLFMHKGKDQVYIQTGHGDRCFKKVLYDVRTLLPDGHYLEGDLAEPEICDLAVSGSLFMNSLYRTAFGYKGEILTCGCPRNDRLLERDIEMEKGTRNMLGIKPECSVLMYAPTFRDSKQGVAQEINVEALEEVIASLEKKTNKDWKCIVRAHSASAGFSKLGGSERGIIDVTEFEDMADLLPITDLLITDYSSVAGDFVLLDRPVILFQEDRTEYEKNDRKFYFDINESPFYVAGNKRELIEIIERLDNEAVRQNCRDVLGFYGAAETGRASEAVVEYIISKYM